MDARKSFVRRLLPLLPLLAVAAAHPSLGDEIDLLALSLEELADLRVTSVSRVEERLADAPAAVFVITRDELRRSGVTTIAEALRLAPGVEVARRDAHSWSIALRGFNSDLANKLLVLIDGRSIYSPLYAGVFWDVQDTLLEDIERIEVIAGPGGALWGANAVNGVINIITRSATATTGAFFEAGGGNEEQGFAALRYGGTFGNGIAARGYVKAMDRDSLKNMNGTDAVDSAQMAQGGFRLDWSASDVDRLTLQGDFYRGDNAGVFQNDFTLGTLPSGSTAGEVDLGGSNVLVRWERALEGGADFSLQGYYDRTSRDIPRTYAERRETFDLDFQHHLRANGAHDLLWGAGFRSTGDEIDDSLYTRFVPDARQDETVSAVLQDKIAVKGEQMFLTLGSKFEHNDYSGFEVQPSARFSWTINERRSFWSAISRAVRIPARLDSDLRLTVPVGLAGVPLYVSADGSPSYDSEELIAYEAGYRLRPTERLSFDVAWYYNDYDHLQTVERHAPIIVLTPPAYAVLPHTIENRMTGTSRGGRFVANWQPTDRWRLRFQYSRLNLDLEHELGSRDTSRFNEQGNSPENQAAVYSFLNLSTTLDLYTGVRYVDELPNLGIDSYVAVNAGMTWSPMATLSTSLSLENLNDARHVEFAGKQIERSAFVRVRWTF
jgi:iron complex outermembrane receptor protein